MYSTFSTPALLAFAFATFAPIVSAAHNVTYMTEVVTAYTTFCPSATEITHGAMTYTVTAPTTLTISDCPCTVSKPIYTSSVTVCATCYTSPSVETHVSPVPPVETHPTTTATPSVHPTYAPPPPASNGTTLAPVSPPKSPMASGTGAYSTTGSGTSPPIASYTGAAGKTAVMSLGAMAAGLVGMLLV